MPNKYCEPDCTCGLHKKAPKYVNQPHIKRTPPSAANYSNGCRCEDCRTAKSAKELELRHRTRETVKYVQSLGAKQ